MGSSSWVARGAEWVLGSIHDSSTIESHTSYSFTTSPPHHGPNAAKSSQRPRIIRPSVQVSQLAARSSRFDHPSYLSTEHLCICRASANAQYPVVNNRLSRICIICDSPRDVRLGYLGGLYMYDVHCFLKIKTTLKLTAKQSHPRPPSTIRHPIPETPPALPPHPLHIPQHPHLLSPPIRPLPPQHPRSGRPRHQQHLRRSALRQARYALQTRRRLVRLPSA